MSSGLGPTRLLRRQLLADRGVGIVVVVVVLVVSGLVAAWPRAVEHIFTDGMHESVNGEPARTRDLVTVLSFGGHLATDNELAEAGEVTVEQAYGAFDTALEDVRSSIPEPLHSTLGEAEYVLSGPATNFGDHADYWPEEIRNGELTLTADPGYLDRVQLTAGTAPRVEVEQVDPVEVYGPPVNPAERGADAAAAEEGTRWFDTAAGGLFVAPPGETVGLITVEIAMTTATAEDFGWEVGEARELRQGINVRLSAIFEPVDPADSYWAHHGSILDGHEYVDFNAGSTMIGQAYVDPLAIGHLTSTESFVAFGEFPVSMRLWFPLDIGGQRVAAAPEVLDQLRAVLAEPPAVGRGPGTDAATVADTPMTLRFATDSTDVVEQTIDAQAGAAALIAMAAAGPLGATIAVLALALKLLVERRRSALSLVGSRGASLRQLRGVLAVEGLLLGVPAAAVATYVVHRFVPGEGGLAGWALPVLIGITPLVLLPVFVRPTRLAGERRDLGKLRRGWLRWTAEALVVATAGTALWLLGRRGLEAGAVTSGVDPLLAATPLLLALAACIVVLRLYPIPVALLSRLWRGRPGLVSYVGAARAVRDPAGGLGAILALVVGLAVGVLSTVLWATTQEGVADAAEVSVGADLRADGPAFTEDELARVAALPGVDAVTGVNSLGRIALTGRDGRSDTVDVFAADLATLAAIQDGFAEQLDVPAEALIGGEAAVPVVASPSVGQVGYIGSLSHNRTFDVEVVSTDDGVAGVTRGGRWVIIDRNVLQESVDTAAGSLPRTMLIGTGDSGALREPVADVLPPEAQLRSRSEAAAAAAGGAVGTGMRTAFIVAAVVGGLLAAAAVIITMVIAAPSRGRLFSQLRTLGLSGRQAGGLATWELAPLAVTAVLSGSLLGLAIPWLLLPSVDLRGLTGGASQPGMSVDWTLVGGAVGGFVVVAILAMSVAVASSRRLRLGTVLRVGEET